MELENKSHQIVSHEEASSLTSGIRMIFSYLPKEQFSIITKENVEVMLPPDQTLEDCVGTCAVETGRILNAHWIVSGRVIKFGSGLKSTIKLHETESGRYVTGIQVKGASLDDLEEPLLLGSLKLLYRVYPVFRDHLINRTESEDVERHLMCLLDQVLCHPKKVQNRLRSRGPTEEAERHDKDLNRVKDKVQGEGPGRAASKPSIFASIARSISEASRIKLDQYHKQRIVFFDLNNGAFVRSGEGLSASHLLREKIHRLNPQYFSIISKAKMIQKLPAHSDMMCRQHGHCIALGRMLNAHWIFAGDLIRFGRSLSVFLRLYDVKTGLMRASEVLTGETVAELEALMTPSVLREMLNMEE